MSFFEELAAQLPSKDTAHGFRGDTLQVIRPRNAMAKIQQFVDPQTLTGLVRAKSRSAVANILDGDTAVILRTRNRLPNRLAVLERVGADKAIVKLFLGPFNPAWSDTDEALYSVGIRMVEATLIKATDRRALEGKPGHTVIERTLKIDYDKFRNHLG